MIILSNQISYFVVGLVIKIHLSNIEIRLWNLLDLTKKGEQKSSQLKRELVTQKHQKSLFF